MDITTIKYPSHADLVQWYYQLAQKIAEGAGVTPEEVNALIEAYIDEHPYPVVPADILTVSNAPSNVVTSVNGEKGDVTVTSGGDVPENVITEDNIAENAVTSFNGEKGAVTGVASVNGKTGAVTVTEAPSNVITTDNIAENSVTSFNGTKGDVTGVSSVNGQTGDVIVPEPPDNIITEDNISTKAVTSINGQVGAVTAPISVITDIQGKSDLEGGFIVDFGTHGFAIYKIIANLASTINGIAYTSSLPTDYKKAVKYVITGVPLDRVYFKITATTFTHPQNVVRTYIEEGSQPNPATARFAYLLAW